MARFPNENRLRESGKKRTESVRRRIEATLAKIAGEIEEGRGIYPYGRLSQAEICRRARVSPITLHGKHHKDTTLVRVHQWLDDARKAMLHGRKVVHRDVTERIRTLTGHIAQLSTRVGISYALRVDALEKVKEKSRQCDALQARAEAAEEVLAETSSELRRVRAENERLKQELKRYRGR